jgi:hypothetical protein
MVRVPVQLVRAWVVSGTGQQTSRSHHERSSGCNSNRHVASSTRTVDAVTGRCRPPSTRAIPAQFRTHSPARSTCPGRGCSPTPSMRCWTRAAPSGMRRPRRGAVPGLRRHQRTTGLPATRRRTAPGAGDRRPPTPTCAASCRSPAYLATRPRTRRGRARPTAAAGHVIVCGSHRRARPQRHDRQLDGGRGRPETPRHAWTSPPDVVCSVPDRVGARDARQVDAGPADTPHGPVDAHAACRGAGYRRR